MKKSITELNVYTHGDSAKLSTWSNIPYLLTNALIKKGIVVNRIDINPNKFYEKVFNRAIWRVLRKLTGYGHFYEYIRTRFYYREVDRKIKRAIGKYPNADAEFFISFSHSGYKFTKKPKIMFGDWTIAYYFEHFLNSEPGILDRAAIKRQDEEIKYSDLVISLFPGTTEYLKNYYNRGNIVYLGNVINVIDKYPGEELVQVKTRSNKILFIGSKRYLDGLLRLISAFKKLKTDKPGTTLHIIGMSKKDFDVTDDSIFAYGYLDKGNRTDCEQYYQLLKEAKVIVNTTEKWGAFSSMAEAMFFYTPVITTPYSEFINTFGSDIQFGFLVENNSEKLEKYLSQLFDDSLDTHYILKCYAAHQAVKSFTWDNYINRLISSLENFLADSVKLQ